jgi:hypothetical protein
MVTETTERPRASAVVSAVAKKKEDTKMDLSEDAKMHLSGGDSTNGQDAKSDVHSSSQNGKDEKTDIQVETVSFDCELSRSLIAGALGHIEVRVKHSNIFVMLDPNQVLVLRI